MTCELLCDIAVFMVVMAGLWLVLSIVWVDGFLVGYIWKGIIARIEASKHKRKPLKKRARDRHGRFATR
jgi:hypothetical protein